jgi:hypothetical protein
VAKAQDAEQAAAAADDRQESANDRLPKLPKVVANTTDPQARIINRAAISPHPKTTN